MSSTPGSNEGAAVVGYAHSPVSRNADVSLGELTLRTVLEAVADAGLDKGDIDGFTTGALFPSSGGRAPVDGEHIVTSDWLVEHLGIQPRWLCGFQGIGQICGSVVLAANAVSSGSADYVVVHRAMYNPPGRYHANSMTRAEGNAQWTAPHGFWGPPAHIALPYMEYMQRYGATREEMATVVEGARQAGSRVPWSHWYQNPLESGEYLGARMIADPISVLDCDIPITGVGAFVLTSAARARDLPNRPVYVAGFAQGRSPSTNGVGAWTLESIQEGGRAVAEILWKSCGFGPEEVDVPQVYDGFSPFVYFWLEALGFCQEGTAHEYVQGSDISPGLPFRVGGGALGNGRMHGVPQMLESYLQLAGRAEDRQLDGVETAIACQAAPNMGGVVAYTNVR